MVHGWHDAPGRLAVRIPSLKRSPRQAEAVRRLVEELPGTDCVLVSTATGTLTVTYDPGSETAASTILAALREAGFLDEPVAPGGPPLPATTPAKSASS